MDSAFSHRARPLPPEWLLEGLPVPSHRGTCVWCLAHAPRGTVPAWQVNLYALGPRQLCVSCWYTLRLSLLLQRLYAEHDQFHVTLETLELTSRHVAYFLGFAQGEEETVLREWELID